MTSRSRSRGKKSPSALQDPELTATAISPVKRQTMDPEEEMIDIPSRSPKKKGDDDEIIVVGRTSPPRNPGFYSDSSPPVPVPIPIDEPEPPTESPTEPPTEPSTEPPTEGDISSPSFDPPEEEPKVLVEGVNSPNPIHVHHKKIVASAGVFYRIVILQILFLIYIADLVGLYFFPDDHVWTRICLTTSLLALTGFWGLLGVGLLRRV